MKRFHHSLYAMGVVAMIPVAGITLACADLPKEQLVCTRVSDGKETFRSVPSAAWKMSNRGVWHSTPREGAEYRQSPQESCRTERSK